MKASKFTDAQKAFILKQGTDGMPVADTAERNNLGTTSLSSSSSLKKVKPEVAI